MTAMKDAFIIEYLKDLNATQAAIRAGYSEATAGQAASRLMNDPNVSRALQEALDKRAARTQIDADYVLRQAVKLHERCMQEVRPKMYRGQPIKDEDGNPVYEFNAAGAAKSLELVGKHVGVQAFKDRVDVVGSITGRISLSGLTQEQIEAIAAAGVE